MNPDTRMEDARRRMEMRPPVVMENEGQMNDDPNYLGAYPRVMYRKTDVEQREMQPGAEGFDDKEVQDKTRVVNTFSGLMCDTIIANSASEAETLSADGWDISPEAAYGVVTGMAAATTAKDDEIAALKAQLAAASEKRGPGRPPKAEERVLQPES